MSVEHSCSPFDDYQPRTLIKSQSSNTSSSGANVSPRQPIQKSYSEVQNGSPRQVDHIDEIRRLVREQSSITGGAAAVGGQYLDDDEVDVPIRKFTPLPDIPRSDDAYYRTESRLIKERVSPINSRNNSIFIENSSTSKETGGSLRKTSSGHNDDDGNNSGDDIIQVNNQGLRQLKKDTVRYHFGGGSMINSKVNYSSHRLPSLEKTLTHTIHNTMDLDEDLPMNPISTPEYINQRMIYTSPGDRVISPIKRPQAPSPAASAYRRKSNKSFNNSQSDSDNDLIIT